MNLSQSQDDDEKEDSESPILDSFVQSGGAQAVHTLTKFSHIEFQEIFDRLRENIAKKIQQRERKTFAVSRR